MSRLGVIQSWMVLLHSKVPQIRKKPDTKQVATSSGTEVVLAQMMLASRMTEQQRSNVGFDLTAIFSRNIMPKKSAMPTSEA